tara:strand:+ start:1258 stop:1659 length:402 start_codon:yes stop_codon:yes gene_type:complete
MAKIDTISLSGDSFVDVAKEGILGMIVSNTDNEDITFDLVVGPKSLHNGTATTGAVFILKEIPIPVGSTFVWDDEDVLTNAFNPGSTITTYESTRGIFKTVSDYTFLIRVGSGHTADVTMRRADRATLSRKIK